MYSRAVAKRNCCADVRVLELAQHFVCGAQRAAEINEVATNFGVLIPLPDGAGRGGMDVSGASVGMGAHRHRTRGSRRRTGL